MTSTVVDLCRGAASDLFASVSALVRVHPHVVSCHPSTYRLTSQGRARSRACRCNQRRLHPNLRPVRPSQARPGLCRPPVVVGSSTFTPVLVFSPSAAYNFLHRMHVCARDEASPLRSILAVKGGNNQTACIALGWRLPCWQAPPNYCPLCGYLSRAG